MTASKPAHETNGNDTADLAPEIAELFDLATASVGLSARELPPKSGADAAIPAELNELFDLMAASFGFDGEGLLPKLAAGRPLAEAAAIPGELLELLYGRAHLLVKAGHIQRAEQVFQALCLVNPHEPNYLAGFGLCLTRRGAWSRARQAFDKALAVQPDWALMHVYCLEASVHLKDWARASEHSSHMRELSGEIPKDLVTLAARYDELLAAHSHLETVESGSI